MPSTITLKIHGKTYTLFDWCATGEEVKMELKELRAAGYVVRCTKAKEGWHIWCANSAEVIFG